MSIGQMAYTLTLILSKKDLLNVLEQLNWVMFPPDQKVKVKGLKGVFVVIKPNADGSLVVFGGTKGRERYRSFAIDRLAAVKIKGSRKNGKLPR